MLFPISRIYIQALLVVIVYLAGPIRNAIPSAFYGALRSDGDDFGDTPRNLGTYLK